MDKELWDRVQKAFEAVQSGVVKRADVSDQIIVYRAGTVIRIDVKGQ